MTLFIYEWRKLFRLPALWGFLLLCLIFNWYLIGANSYSRGPFNQVSAVTADLGQRVDETFQAGLAVQASDELRDVLAATAAGMENIYEDYDLASLSRFYQNRVVDSPMASDWMAWKYRLLEPRMEHLAQTGAAMDLYAGPWNDQTHGSFQFLFGILLRSVLMEAAVLGMLSGLYLLGYEEISRTGQQAASSRVGWQLYRTKVLSGLAAGLALYALLAVLTLPPYFALWDYGGVWGASVSSQFNYLLESMLRRPFFTWADFTVAGYLAASLAVGGGLTAVFCLLAAVCGILVRNIYLSALTLGLICLGLLTAVSVCGGLKWWPLYLILTLQPMLMCLSSGGWFTEMGMNGAVPWQETASVMLNLTLLGLGVVLALKRFSRKDVL